MANRKKGAVDALVHRAVTRLNKREMECLERLCLIYGEKMSILLRRIITDRIAREGVG